MEPSIRFCTSTDGTQLAYATLGRGYPLLHVPGFSTNVELEWKDPEGRAWMERIAADRLLVRCQRRGVGASQRDVDDVSLRAQVEDLTAVVDHAGLKEVDILGAYDGVAVALAYAVANPARVSHLVLWAAYARGIDVNAAQAYNALADLARQNWRLFLRTWADLCFPSGPPERQRWYSDLVRHSVSAEVAAAYIEFMRDIDLTGFASGVDIPTLVLHREGDRYVPPSFGRAVAALLPNASFVPLAGDIGLPVLGDSSYLQRVAEFLGGVRTLPAHQPAGGTAIILFTDIVDSTGLTERMGDAAFRSSSGALDGEMRRAIREAGGVPIDGKVLGDGVMAVFTSASQAIDAAQQCVELSAQSELQLHVGLHAGDVIREGNNVYGGAVNIAARVCGSSEPGEILVSATVRELARTSAGVEFQDRGEQEMKGVGDPVRVYAVRRRE